MGLNISKGNMYEFVTHTWNTIKGKCFHDCSYCYMKRWKNQKSVRFDHKELNTDLGQHNFIFVGSSCDMFASDIPDEWILKTFDHCLKAKFNNYLFQTKNPERLLDFLPILNRLNPIICTTIETNRSYPEIMKNSPTIEKRISGMKALINYKKFITIEPIMDFDFISLSELIKSAEVAQINIGADSGNNNLPEPKYSKIKALTNELSKFTTIKNKKNLSRLEE